MNLSINQAQKLQSLTQLSPATGQPQTLPQQSVPISGMGTDALEIKKGLLPTVKGAGMGLLAGGVLAGAGAYIPNVVIGHVTGNVDEYASMAILMGGGLGAMAGAITGAVVANVTNDSKKAALYGAAVGGGVGLVLGMAGGGVKGALTWSAMGAGAGLGGAWAGAHVAKAKQN